MKEITNIPKNSAILIIGKPLSNKKDIIYNLISKNLKKDNPVLFVTTDHFPKEIESDLRKNKIQYKKYEKQGNLIFIDCYSAQTQNSISSTKVVKKVPGPLALNEISVAISEIESDFYKKNKKPLIIFQSLSTMLIYSKPEAIQRFVQVIIAKVKNAGSSILFTIEEGMHDKKTIIGLEHLMNGIIEIKNNKPILKLI